MKELAEDYQHRQLMASVFMVNKHTPHRADDSEDIVTRNLDQIELFFNQLDWTGHDITLAQDVLKQHRG
jgi:hypothetical protein